MQMILVYRVTIGFPECVLSNESGEIPEYLAASRTSGFLAAQALQGAAQALQGAAQALQGAAQALQGAAQALQGAAQALQGAAQ